MRLCCGDDGTTYGWKRIPQSPQHNQRRIISEARARRDGGAPACPRPVPASRNPGMWLSVSWPWGPPRLSGKLAERAGFEPARRVPPAGSGGARLHARRWRTPRWHGVEGRETRPSSDRVSRCNRSARPSVSKAWRSAWPCSGSIFVGPWPCSGAVHVAKLKARSGCARLRARGSSRPAVRRNLPRSPGNPVPSPGSWSTACR